MLDAEPVRCAWVSGFSCEHWEAVCGDENLLSVFLLAVAWGFSTCECKVAGGFVLVRETGAVCFGGNGTHSLPYL